MAPSFEEATEQLRKFLAGQGWPTRIVWVDSSRIRICSDQLVIQRPGPHEINRAQSCYEERAQKNLGVLLHAVGKTQDSAFVVVKCPADSREAELEMYPADGGLKLSLRLSLPVRVRVAGVIGWWWFRDRGHRLES